MYVDFKMQQSFLYVKVPEKYVCSHSLAKLRQLQFLQQQCQRGEVTKTEPYKRKIFEEGLSKDRSVFCFSVVPTNAAKVYAYANLPRILVVMIVLLVRHCSFVQCTSNLEK